MLKEIKKKTSESFRTDYAIISRIKQEQKLQNSEKYDRELKFISTNATWFENQQKYEVKKLKKINDGVIRRELLLTNQEIKLRRRERLSELYTYECEILEAELGIRGLSIFKER